MEILQTRGIRPIAPYNLRSAWGGNRMASTDELSGRTVSITRDDGVTMSFAFTGSTVTWREPDESTDSSATFDAVAARDGVYLIDFLHEDTDRLTTIVLNARTGGALFLRHMIVRGNARPDLQQTLYPCVVSGTDGRAPVLTEELVGTRAYAEYAPDQAVEHVYFNPRRIVWQGLGTFIASGSECDQATTWKIDEQLYLLTWVEEWQAVGAALLLDYSSMRNVGVLYGLDEEGLVHTRVGALLRVLSHTDYPKGYEPERLEN